MSLILELVHSKACKGDSKFSPEPLGGKGQVRKSHCDLYDVLRSSVHTQGREEG